MGEISKMYLWIGARFSKYSRGFDIGPNSSRSGAALFQVTRLVAAKTLIGRRTRSLVRFACIPRLFLVQKIRDSTLYVNHVRLTQNSLVNDRSEEERKGKFSHSKITTFIHGKLAWAWNEGCIENIMDRCEHGATFSCMTQVHSSQISWFSRTKEAPRWRAKCMCSSPCRRRSGYGRIGGSRGTKPFLMNCMISQESETNSKGSFSKVLHPIGNDAFRMVKKSCLAREGDRLN